MPQIFHHGADLTLKLLWDDKLINFIFRYELKQIDELSKLRLYNRFAGLNEITILQKIQIATLCLINPLYVQL